MADWSDHEWKLLIGGELVDGANGTVPIVNPATEETVGLAPEAVCTLTPSAPTTNAAYAVRSRSAWSAALASAAVLTSNAPGLTAGNRWRSSALVLPTFEFTEQLVDLGAADQVAAADERAAAVVTAAVAEAKAAPEADPEEAFRDVWADGGAAWRT